MFVVHIINFKIFLSSSHIKKWVPEKMNFINLWLDINIKHVMFQLLKTVMKLWHVLVISWFQISEDVLDAEAEEMEEEPLAEGKDDEEEPSPPEPDGKFCVLLL